MSEAICFLQQMAVIHNTLLSKISNDRFGFIPYSFNQNIKTVRSTFKILFYINRQKTKADGKTGILCRITIDGKSATISTGEECKPSEWNAKQGLMPDRKINQRLHEFREFVEKTYRDILTRDGMVSAELIKNHLQGIATHPTTLLAMSRAELQTVKESVGRSRTESTYHNLSHSNRILREFVEDKKIAGYTHFHHYGGIV